MIKKISSFLLVAIMLIAVFTPLTALAASSGTCGDNLTWTLDNSGTLTIAGTGDMWDWSRNSTWDSLKSSIKKVIINSGVTSIGENAFWLCDSLTTISIPNSVTSIGEYAFHDCDSLTTISIPNSVTSIGDYTFGWCDSLTSISIPNSVTSIGDFAFRSCDSLTTINIPGSVTSIGDSAFYDCYSLTSISVDADNAYYCDVNGVLFSKDKTLIHTYPSVISETSYTIPFGVTSIGEHAFRGCDSLTSISIPNSVTSIGKRAFEGCDSLTSISIPESVMSIGWWTFAYCSKLKNVTINGRTTTISDSFAYCPSDLIIHGYAGSTAETYARNNGFAFVPLAENKVIGTWPHGSLTATLKSDGTFTISGTGSMSEWLVTSAPWYDSRSSIKKVVIDYGVTDIWIGAFASCTNLTSVTIPETVKTIAKEAFVSCTSLATVNLPSGVETIGQDAFSFCTSLKSVTIPGTVTVMGERAFGFCDSLTDIYYGGNETNWKRLSIDAKIPSGATIHYGYAAPGTIIGSALRTNITAVINGHAIPSFNVDGYTYIVAEDLKDYGFSVYYDNNTRTLALNRDVSRTYVSRSYVKPYVAPGEVGIKEHDLVATDIVTYVDNNYVQSFNINGQTIIKFDTLGRYGAVYYDNSTRMISVTIPGLN